MGHLGCLRIFDLDSPPLAGSLASPLTLPPRPTPTKQPDCRPGTRDCFVLHSASHRQGEAAFDELFSSSMPHLPLRYALNYSAAEPSLLLTLPGPAFRCPAPPRRHSETYPRRHSVTYLCRHLRSRGPHSPYLASPFPLRSRPSP
eukprot:scaffold246844_cov26-Tisochrysis_lutea.AAC.6